MMRVMVALLILAAGATSAASRELHATYVLADEVRLERVLPPPPAPGSPEAQADLAAVEAAVKTRTPADERRITTEDACSPDAFAGGIVGPAFTAARAPLTFALVAHAFEDAELAVIAAKPRFQRPRPFKLAPDLATFGHRSKSFSYPSGHATCGRVMAAVLAALVPDKAAALFARGDLYGRDRVLAGTHFPSDVAAGATAGSVVADALFRNARFQADFARALVEMQNMDK